jgi:DNA primase
MPPGGREPEPTPGPVGDGRSWRDWITPASQRTDPETPDVTRARPDLDRALAFSHRAEAGAALLERTEPGRDPELVQLHALAGRFFQACLPGSWVPDYLADRRLDAALLPSSPWKIGYAPATWTALTDYLRRQGYPPKTLLRSGLVKVGRTGHLHDFFRDRLMIPLRNDQGIAVAFIGRRPPGTGDEHGPKYLNSPDTDIFVKGRVLAGLAESRIVLRQGAQPVLVEGPMDAIAVSIAAPGRFTGIAPSGTALTARQVAALAGAVDLADRGLRVALDGDTAGQHAAVRAYPLLQPATTDITAVVLPGGGDPADILATGGRDALRDTLTTSIRPLADLVVDATISQWERGVGLEFGEQQVSAVQAAAKVIATMPASEVGRQAARLAELFTSRYDWHAWEVTTAVIDAVEQHLHTDKGSDLWLPRYGEELASRATAPSGTGTRGTRLNSHVRRSRGFVRSRDGAERTLPSRDNDRGETAQRLTGYWLAGLRAAVRSGRGVSRWGHATG